MNISMFKRCFQRDFGWNQVKYARIRPLSLFFTTVLQIFPIFSPGRDQLLGRAGQKNINPGISPGISPRISPLHEFLDRRAGQLYLTWSIRLGQKPSIKGNTSISI